MTLLSNEPIVQEVIDMVTNGEPSVKIAAYIQRTAMNDVDLRYLICIALISTGRGI